MGRGVAGKSILGGPKMLAEGGGVPINFFEEEGGKVACRNILEGGKVPGFFYPNSRPNFGLTQPILP